MEAWSDKQKASLVASVVNGDLSVQAACARFGVTPEQIREWAHEFRRSAHQALDQRLIESLESQGVAAEELSGAELTGALGDVSLYDVLQTVQMGGKGGLITVTDERGGEHRIWCSRGDVVDAESAPLQGPVALYRILAMTSGRVVVAFREVERQRTIHTGAQALLLEAARRHDEVARLRERLGDARAAYVPSEASAASDVDLPEPQRQILELFDGKRSLGRVLSRSRVGDLETLELVDSLVAEGHLVRAGQLDPTPTPPSSTAALALDLDGPVSGALSMFLPEASAIAQTITQRSAPEPKANRRKWLAPVVAVTLLVAGLLSFRFSGSRDTSVSESPVSDAPPGPAQGPSQATPSQAARRVDDPEMEPSPATAASPGAEASAPPPGEATSIAGEAKSTPAAAQAEGRAASRPSRAKSAASRGAAIAKPHNWRKRARRAPAPAEPPMDVAPSADSPPERSKPAPRPAASRKTRAPPKPRLQVIEDAVPKIQVLD